MQQPAHHSKNPIQHSFSPSALSSSMLFSVFPSSYSPNSPLTVIVTLQSLSISSLTTCPFILHLLDLTSSFSGFICTLSIGGLMRCNLNNCKNLPSDGLNQFGPCSCHFHSAVVIISLCFICEKNPTHFAFYLLE